MVLIDLSQYTCTNNREALQCLYDALVSCPCDGIDPIGPDGLPVAEFEAEPLEDCIPTQVQFTDLSTTPSGAINSWLWDFGDGDTSVLQNPTHTYIVAGTYTVSLTVGNGSGFDTETKVAYISALDQPVADFEGDVLSGDAPLTVQFTDLSTGATSWDWDFGDGGTSILQNPSYEYLNVGTYTVTLTVSNGFCDDEEIKIDYIVTVSPFLFYDSFTGAIGNLVDHTPDVGIDWTEIEYSPDIPKGDFTLSGGGRVGILSPNAGLFYLTNVLGTPNFITTVETYRPNGLADIASIPIRYLDVNNFMNLEVEHADVRLYKTEAGVTTNPLSFVGIGTYPTSQWNVKLTLDGNDIEVELTDRTNASVYSNTYTNALNNTIETSGIGVVGYGAVNPNTLLQYDEFKVEAL